MEFIGGKVEVLGSRVEGLEVAGEMQQEDEDVEEEDVNAGGGEPHSDRAPRSGLTVRPERKCKNMRVTPYSG